MKSGTYCDTKTVTLKRHCYYYDNQSHKNKAKTKLEVVTY
jgi:hypothetical protein